MIGGSGAASILEVVYTLGGPEEDCSDKLSCWLLGESIVSFLLPTPSSPSLFFAQLPLFLLQGERDWSTGKGDKGGFLCSPTRFRFSLPGLAKGSPCDFWPSSLGEWQWGPGPGLGFHQMFFCLSVFRLYSSCRSFGRWKQTAVRGKNWAFGPWS